MWCLDFSHINWLSSKEVLEDCAAGLPTAKTALSNRGTGLDTKSLQSLNSVWSQLKAGWGLVKKMLNQSLCMHVYICQDSTEQFSYKEWNPQSYVNLDQWGTLWAANIVLTLLVINMLTSQENDSWVSPLMV